MLHNAFATMGESPVLRLHSTGFKHCGRFYEVQAARTPGSPTLLCVRVHQVSSPGSARGLDAREKTQRLRQLKRAQDTSRLARRVHHARSKQVGSAQEKALQGSLAARAVRESTDRHMFTFYLRLPGWHAGTESEYQQCYEVVWKWMICGMLRHLPKHKRYLEGMWHAQIALKGSWRQPWVNARAFAPTLEACTRDHLILDIPVSALPHLMPMRQSRTLIFAPQDIRGASFDPSPEQLAGLRSTLSEYGPSILTSLARAYRQGQVADRIVGIRSVNDQDAEEE